MPPSPLSASAPSTCNSPLPGGSMSETMLEESQNRLQLDSQLSELSRVPPWVEDLGVRHGLAAETRYAINLCLEETLANVILHGYKGQPGHPIVIQASCSGDSLFLAVEDKAPPFIPSDPGQRTGVAGSLGNMPLGGNGIHLIYRFAASVDYQPLPDGNRLILGFPTIAAKKIAV
ncbi:ATP-binding protein [Acidobacteria bacterium AB60]|nr:ATP-binding protein [Acidobacteria bacterium AB60]